MPRPTGRATRQPRSVYRRRRLTALAALGALIVLTLLALGALLGEDEEVPIPAQPPVSQPEVPVEELVGQRLVVRMEAVATPTLLRAARRGEIAGVIVFPPPGTDPDAVAREIGRLQQAAREGGRPPLLVATDQEGGEVKRFVEGPPEQAPPELGEAGAESARAAGEETGSYLARLGINVDLAPVLDVAWSPESAIASRAFGTEAETVAEAGGAFADGLASAGVAATAKHFPGLGRASANTDLAPVSIDAPRRDLERDLEPFRAAIGGGVPVVMLSNATYPALDSTAPATWSRPIVTDLLRDELGFAGLVITDDLGAGAVTSVLPPERAAVRAARAGADLLLLASEQSPEDAYRELLEAARNRTLDRDALEQSYDRVLGLKDRL
jgi:beta-N-acetylhexosaminidase